MKGKIGIAFATQERDGGLSVYNELVDWLLRMEFTLLGSNPLPIINGSGPNDWEEDTKGVRALDNLAERVIDHLLGE